MYLLILFLPVLSCFVLLIYGRFFSREDLVLISLISISLACIMSVLCIHEVMYSQSACVIYLSRWMVVSTLYIEWGLFFDSLSTTMFFVVLLISLLVHYYSTEYSGHDPFLIRFLGYLSLFTFLMLVLVGSANYLQLFLGWEGVGLASYLLINFWFTRIQANKSAMKAMIINRFGDIGLYLAILLVLYFFNTTESIILEGLVEQCNNMECFIINLIVFLIFIGAVGKSAQIGLHTWLPDATEGPTPVSALIHAATMVTAGVFVLVRPNIFLEKAPTVLVIILLVGSLTAFFAGSIGGFQYDLKKVIAYSTCSQLGYMVFACGFGSYELSLFHLFNHAFFKALLLLGAGSVIHALIDEQDMRRMGGLARSLPITYFTMLVGSLALIGIPFLSGFYSKDLIMEYALSSNNFYVFWGYISCSLAVLFTTFHSLRLLYLTFYNGCNFSIGNPVESGHKIILVLSILCLLSVIIGFISKTVFISGWVISGHTDSLLNAEFLRWNYKLIPLIFIILGIYSFIICHNLWVTSDIFHFFNQKWYFDLLYNNIIISLVIFFSYHIGFKLVDRGFLEYIGPFGVSVFSDKIFRKFQKFFSGYIYHSILLIILITSLFSLIIFFFFYSLLFFCLVSITVLWFILW